MKITIEIEHSSHTGPPGSTGQHGQRGSLWYRFDGGSWWPVVWTTSKVRFKAALVGLGSPR